MADVLDAMLRAIDSNDDRAVSELVSAQDARLKASAGRGRRRLVSEAEAAVRRAPREVFVFDDRGAASLIVGDQVLQAGHFDIVSIRRLRERATAVERDPDAHLRLLVLTGTRPVTDIGGLQASSNEQTVFQIASQFNCLESPGPYVTPVAEYFRDPTQGPRGAISAFAGALLRHYSAPGPDGRRFTQETGRQQVDLLAEVHPGVSRNGYLTGACVPDVSYLVRHLIDQFDRICVGVQADTEVVLGYDWDGEVSGVGPLRITQVLTSTVAGGMYGAERHFGAAGFHQVCEVLLHAAYLGTLLYAICSAKRVVLTLIGGGAFGNPTSIIWAAIGWALRECRRLVREDFDVVINARALSDEDRERLVMPLVRDLGGTILDVHGKGPIDVWRV